jgi:LmbE family N-acetylglucosaminyl deacetylase
MTLRVLALHAHPDDLETFAAGALALLAKAGATIVMATLTAGECGSTANSPEITGAMRRGEAATAARLIGAHYRCLGAPDLGVFNDAPTRRAVVALLREVRPDLVLAAPMADYHPDHEAVGRLARDACFAASVPAYVAGEAPPLPAIPHLYWIDPVGGRDADGRATPADLVVDISSVITEKRQMLAAHKSQADWLRQQHGIEDFVAAMEVQSARRGAPYGVAFAEGYRQYRGHPFPREPLLQTLLGPYRVDRQGSPPSVDASGG